ncbi:hypothetical protein E4U57_001133 [Claviceps arundinis]|uniref:UmuC domain-containing protein n=1 Tax=Claviceps arundinis TaxID=1623583 RepID=A0ABQ7PB87_9HYPO|nr:hypothetical protein E4U57_001133 [Claviceps arundinis]
MDQRLIRPPRQKHESVILQFDYDCFYAQVFENRDPSLKFMPLGVRQKNILATCNYNARKLGVKKLMLVSEARELCKGLVLVDGEDLSPFRDMSKILFNFLRSYSWNNKAERLGFDEVFMDVTDIVDYNIECLSTNNLSHSFFFLSKANPEAGFPCDLTNFSGCVEGDIPAEAPLDNKLYLRLLLGSHLANFLRTQIETKFGYTSACGISTNKLLSKLVGARNKPRNQTTLLALTEDHVCAFMDAHKTRQVPGIGSKTAMQLESHVLGKQVKLDSQFTSNLFVREVRLHPSMSPGFLDTLLASPGAERGVGARVWGLLHGVDTTEVRISGNIPSQISIEDTFKGLETVPQITEELNKLSCSLIRRLRVDLLSVDQHSDLPRAQKWIARPRTLRLSIRSRPTHQGISSSQNIRRVSRSGLLPSFVFDTHGDIDALAQKLVAESLFPLLRQLRGDKGSRWNVQLINICAANMVAGASDDRDGAGRDISAMFKGQEEVLRPFRAHLIPEDEKSEPMESSSADESEQNADWDDEVHHSTCTECGHYMPLFAMAAHRRFHEVEEQESYDR